MNKKTSLSYKVWNIIYPVGMYYAAITIGIFLAQLLFGTSNESYMLCKIIGSLVALPIVYTYYKQDLIMSGDFGKKISFSKELVCNVIVVSLITVCISIALNNIISMSPLMTMSVEYENASNAFYGSTIWLELLGSALITPLLEEVLHRGVVYGRLRKGLGVVPAIFLSALIFAALHFNVVQFLYAFLLGIVLAVFVEKTGHIYPSILAHIVANGIAVIRTETGVLSKTVDGSIFAWVISFALLFLGITGIIWYYRHIKIRKEDK